MKTKQKGQFKRRLLHKTFFQKREREKVIFPVILSHWFLSLFLSWDKCTEAKFNYGHSCMWLMCRKVMQSISFFLKWCCCFWQLQSRKKVSFRNKKKLGVRCHRLSLYIFFKAEIWLLLSSQRKSIFSREVMRKGLFLKRESLKKSGERWDPFLKDHASSLTLSTNLSYLSSMTWRMREKRGRKFSLPTSRVYLVWVTKIVSCLVCLWLMSKIAERQLETETRAKKKRHQRQEEYCIKELNPIPCLSFLIEYNEWRQWPHATLSSLSPPSSSSSSSSKSVFRLTTEEG